MKTIKQDDALMKLLNGVTTIRRIICNTNKGALELELRKGETNYHLVLDSVPLDKEENDKIMDLLFKPEIPEVTKEPITQVQKVVKTSFKEPKKNKATK